MYFVIQCASSKDERAPFLRASTGRRLAFVAHPEVAPANEKVEWAHPDHPSDVPGETWRQVVQRNDASGNPRALWPAWKLYRPPQYELLVRTFGADRTLILSAGWGLVRADFPLPPYDITFARSDDWKQRSVRDRFADFNHLRAAPGAPIVFLGGKDYLPLFHALTHPLAAKRIIPFRCAPADTSSAVRREGDVTWIPYRTPRCTNWHYSCVEDICRDPASLLAYSQ